MSKKQFRSQASSSRAGSSAFGPGFGTSAFGAHSSPLSYVYDAPDLSGISDANAVVSVKNLMKKDSTTKAKALEDLQAYVTSSATDLEEALLAAWVKLYPRLSIDNSRRVRQAAHVVQGHIASKCGKRIVKHIPALAGPWLAGAQDSDKAAARAAQDALKHTFQTSEKLQNLGKAFQQPILEYCRDAIINETVKTLSDERTVSLDDAEATYARVIATSLAVISNLLIDLPAEEIGKQQDTYNAILGESKIWHFAAYPEVTVRRLLFRLLRVCLAKEKATVEHHTSIISTAFIDKALPADQAGSSTEFMRTLVELTSAFPEVWTSHYTGKKSASQRLKQCIKRGSQGGPPDFWTHTWQLFSILPGDVLPDGYAEVKDFLGALREGVSRREERFNSSTAWFTYFKVVDLVEDESRMPSPLSEEEHAQLIDDMVLPVIEQYLRPAENTAGWTISGAKVAMTVSKVALCRRLPPRLQLRWHGYASSFVEDIKTSLPEQAKDFDKSQNAIAAAGERWAQLQIEFLHGDYTTLPAFQDVFLKAARSIVHESLALLVVRNGKPYGAAAVVDAFIGYSDGFMLSDQQIHDETLEFLLEEAPQLLYSQSQRQLVSLLYHFIGDPRFNEAWTRMAQAAANHPDAVAKLAAFNVLLLSPKIKSISRLAAKNRDVQHLLQMQHQTSLQGETDWSFIASVLKHSPDVISAETRDAMLSDLTYSLTLSDRSAAALDGLEHIASANRSTLKGYLGAHSGARLLPSLLLLEESENDAISQRASTLSKSLVEGAEGDQAQSYLFDVILQGISDVSPQSLPLHTLLEMGGRLADNAGPEEAMELLPELNSWQTAILPFRTLTIPLSLAITNPLGGAVYLSDGTSSKVNPLHLPRDAEGFSQALRAAMFVAGIFSSRTALFDMLSFERKAQVFGIMGLIIVFANDNITVAGANGLWSMYSPEVEAEVLEFTIQARMVTTHCLRQSAKQDDEYAFVGGVLKNWLESYKGSSSGSYYHGRAFVAFESELVEIQGHDSNRVQMFDEVFSRHWKAREVRPVCACAAAFGESLWNHGALTRYCNELVADLTGLDIQIHPDKALEQVVLFNCIIPDGETVSTVVAKQRIIFLVKHILPWLGHGDASSFIKSEVCKFLSLLLPGIGDLYGDHWSEVLGFIVIFWNAGFVNEEDKEVDEGRLPLVHSSLKLFACLRALKSREEPNDDLLDASKESEAAIAQGLISLLKQSEGLTDDSHQPLKITNDLIAREIDRLPQAEIEEAGSLYPLLYTPSQSIQRTAFNLLHRYIPAKQEQISFDSALENKAAQLPEELLSLILEAPTLDSLADASYHRSMPLDLQGYLYSWCLVFDHFTNSSYKVKSDYIENLKDGTYLGGLLDLVFDFLGHSAGKPVDVSKLDVVSYTPDVEEAPARDAQWLLAHLYYLALTHVPSLAKAHYLALTSRQTSLAVEAWTAKYMSPLIISQALAAVAQWAVAQTTDDAGGAAGDADKLIVRVAMRSREVNVGYVVDEQTMAIVVRLPETYPLTGARVEGVSRVAVDEKRWQSWLRNCQGVITFSNGNLIDGLSAWRKNVTGALKGQTECAICYSIISGDKQLPSKRCGTCKNLFHSSCLYKWFKTSNASSCPLCRNPFNYG